MTHSYLLVQAQVQVDQGPIHKNKYTVSNRRENREKPQTHGQREIFPKQNTNGLCSKIKRDLIKLQSLCKAKDIVNRTKRQPTYWEKIFTNPTSEWLRSGDSRCWGGWMWRKMNIPSLVVGFQAGATTLEISIMVPQKIGHSVTR